MKPIKKQNLVVFDFDGTLAKTIDNPEWIYRELALKYNLKAFTPSGIKANRHLPYRERLKVHDISLLKMPFMIRKTRRMVTHLIKDAKPFPGIKDVLLTLKDEGYLISIISSNTKKNIQLFNALNDMPSFDMISEKASFFGKAKKMRKQIKRLHPKHVIYVGDEQRDIEAMRSLNLPIISVTWGHDDCALLKEKTDYLCDKPEDLTAIIFNHFHKEVSQ